jgi:hypothetical protein
MYEEDVLSEVQGEREQASDFLDREYHSGWRGRPESICLDLARRYLICDNEVRHLRNLRREVQRLTEQKDGAYSERDQLVAALSRLFPASLERHYPEDDDWDDDWRWVVFIDLPTGQASWHIHDSELPMFDHLLRKAGRVWDGHSTEEKYKRLAAMEARGAMLDHFAGVLCAVFAKKRINELAMCEIAKLPGVLPVWESHHIGHEWEDLWQFIMELIPPDVIQRYSEKYGDKANQ